MFKSGLAGKKNLLKQISKCKMTSQHYDSFLIIDFEATCQERVKLSNPEIIEFPCLKVNGRDFLITEKFHTYVKPVLNPQLSTFCTKLTGITQEMVDESETFPTAFGNFQSWLMEKVGPEERFLFVICGDWDLKAMLPSQCKRENIVLPSYFETYMNIKKAFAHQTGMFSKGMLPMLKDLNIQHVGKHHSGIDDCINIANILKALSDMGCVFRPTEGKNRHGPPAPPPLADYVKAGASSKLDTDEGLSKSECREKSSMYPSLSECNFPNSNMSSSLYEPYESTDGDRHMHNAEASISDDTADARCSSDNYDVNSKDMLDNYAASSKCPNNKKSETNNYLDKEKGSEYLDKNKKKCPEASIKCSDKFDLECPDFPSIVLKLKENLFSKNFKSRDQEELHALCAAGKYLHTMESEDKCLVEARLRFFYVTLVYGHRVAEKDAKALSTADVGIRVDPKLIHRRHHKEKGSRKQKHCHSNYNDQFEFI